MQHELSLQYRVSQRSIDETIKIIMAMRETNFSLQASFMEERYAQIHKRAFAGTMMATGELRSKLFNRQRSISKDLIMFSCGYDPTTNNQSVAQEFKPGKVHQSKESHFTEDDQPKCR